MQPTGVRWPTPNLTCAISFAIAVAAVLSAPAWAGEPSHGFAYFGNLKYPPEMPHFDYVNAQAPKGGRVNIGSISTFNNLNPNVDKGNLAHYIDPRYGSGSYIYDPLMRRGEDELASYYCWLAETVEVADDYSWVTYKLRENVHWHDGRPVTMEDVLWTFDMIKRKGSITWRKEYEHIVRLEQIDAFSFRFHFSDDAEKTPFLVILTASFAPLPKHFWEDRAFDETTLEIPLGNGPYRIASVIPGYKVIFQRVPDYWGRDLNVTVGHFNFEEIHLTYYFDKRVMLQALRAGLLDFYFEENENDFATAYDFDGYHQGLFKKETYRMGYSYGMHFGLVFNTRREPFNDIRVREALTLAYNFEWANRVYWHSGMKRNNSYFVRSGLQSGGLPSAEELELLRPLRGRIPERVFTDPVELPENHAFGRNRKTLLDADALLEEAGWVVRDFRRVHEITREPFSLQLLVTYQDHERMLVPFAENLTRLGIDAVLRRVERNILTNRLRSYDFDATVRKLRVGEMPDRHRLRSQFTSQYADLPNMRNYAGIQNPAIDFLVEKILESDTEEAMNTAGRALDRVLLHSFYVIPDGHPAGRHVTHWTRIRHPPLGFEHMNWTGFPHLWWFGEDESAETDAVTAKSDESRAP